MLKQRQMIAAITVLCAFVPAAMADVGPWHSPPSDRGSSLLVTHGDASDQSGWYVTLKCAPSSGFEMTLLTQPTFGGVVTGISGKVGSHAAVVLTPDQDRRLPAMINIKGADVLERQLLHSESLTLRISLLNLSDRIVEFHFEGIKQTEAAILKICPPF